MFSVNGTLYSHGFIDSMSEGFLAKEENGRNGATVVAFGIYYGYFL